MDKNKYNYRLLNPRYWFTWLLLGVIRSITLLPYAAQMQCGHWIGLLAHRFAIQRRNIAQINIQLCFPEKNSQQQTQLLREHFISLGKGIIETALCWWGNENSLHRLITITGMEHLDQAAAKGKGVLLLSAHFTTLEIGGRLLASQHPFQVLYRKHKNPVFEHVMHNARQCRFKNAIPRNNTRALISSLSNANAVWYAPDQNHAGANSQFLPFFDILASTTTATSRIAKISHALVIPFFQVRLPENKGYLLTICPPLEHFPSEDLHQDTVRINRLLERVIREHPEQYLWSHRRFRTRPDNAPSIY